MAVLTPAQVAQHWTGAGGGSDKETIAEAVAYAWIESGYRTDAQSPTGCVGIWQICGTKIQGDLTDPSVNARAAVAKWKGCSGGSFACDWTPYDFGPANPNWEKGYADGLAAAAGASAAPSSGSNTSGSGITGFGATVASGIGDASRSVADTAVGLALAVLGLAAAALVLWLLLKDTSTGRALSSTVRAGARTAVLAVAHV